MFMTSLQRINSRRYNRADLKNGIAYLKYGVIRHLKRAMSFEAKWRNATVIGEKIFILGKEVIPTEDIAHVLMRAYTDPL